MTGKKEFWYALMGGTLGLWVMGCLVPWQLLQNPLAGAAVPGLMLVLHLAEMPHAMRMGRDRGVGSTRVLVFTLLFGFTWWLPLQRGIISH